MSAPHIILDSLPSYCQKLSDFLVEIWWKFDVVITKIILIVFFSKTWCSYDAIRWDRKG